MLKSKVIERGFSNWDSNVVLAKKPDENGGFVLIIAKLMILRR